MYWKNNIWVIDDVISKEEQEIIKKRLLGPGFCWKFVQDITGGGSRDQRPGFSHTFINDSKVHPYEEEADIKILQALWSAGLNYLFEKTQKKENYSVVKSRAFLQVPLRNISEGEYDAHHIDHMDKHLAFLYYVCDADGDTVLFENMYSKENPTPPEPNELTEKTRVTPKQGRLVIFDGYYWHTATQPTQNVRCVINSDIVVT